VSESLVDRAAGLKLRLALAVALALAALAVTIVAIVDRSSQTTALRTDDLSAEALVDSIGVVVHFNHVDTAYGRQAELIARLRELGVRHIGDAMPSPVEPLGTGLRAAAGEGIRATLGAGDLDRDPRLSVTDALNVLGRDGIDAFQGPNEIDATGGPDWPDEVADYMVRLAAAVRQLAPGVPVVGPSLVSTVGRRLLPADLPGLYNTHPYPGGKPPEPVLEEKLRERPPAERDRGVIFSETGYHNALAATAGGPPASEQATAVYLPRLLLAAFGAGVRRTFIYELVDGKPDPALVDPEQHFGLLRNDLSPKPAFTAIQTLIAALGGSSAESPRLPLRWDLRIEGGAEVKRLSLFRRDGSRVIALWRPISVWDRDARRDVAPEPVSATLAFGPKARDVVVWRPSRSTRPVMRREDVRTVPLSLEGDVVLVSLR
jgi:hypothetical protein